MKAAVYTRYGLPREVVRIEEVEKPAPGEGEVLIAVRAAGLNLVDTHYMRGKPLIARFGFGLRGPKLTRPGVDVAGIVESVGAGVTEFGPGDRVFGACRGSLAEYATAPEARLAAIPAGLDFTQAAAIPIAGVTALQGLRDKGAVKAGQHVLVVGASGGIGSFAVQIARMLGARVTAVCGASNLELVRSLGAERAIDYMNEDYLAGGEAYDLVFDIASAHSFLAIRRVLKPGGMLIPAGMMAGGGAPGSLWVLRWIGRTVSGLIAARFSSRRLGMCMARLRREDLDTLAGLAAAGTIRPVIDRIYRLDQAAEALAHMMTGHARGKVIVAIGGDDG
jgi:NADPH:quinone reductase-like Zn-dependent oxidoreductase